jgi:hypothetical protein
MDNIPYQGIDMYGTTTISLLQINQTQILKTYDCSFHLQKKMKMAAT